MNSDHHLYSGDRTTACHEVAAHRSSNTATARVAEPLIAAALTLGALSWLLMSCGGGEPSEGTSPPSDAGSSGAESGQAGSSDAGSSGAVRVPPGGAVQIRSLNALSGDQAFLGVGNQRGVELAIADYGEVKGFPIDLGSGVDGLCAADGGQAAAQTIVADEQVVGVIGPSCSVTATAAAPLIAQAGMVMIAPSNTSPALTSDLAGNPGANRVAGYFRTSHNDLFQGRAVAEFLYNVMGFRTAATIHDGDPYSQGLATAFADVFESLGGAVDSGRINKEDSNMEPVLLELATGEPEALFLPVFRPAGDFIAEQARGIPGLEATRLIAAPSLGDDFLRLPQSEGMFFTGPDIRLGGNVNRATGMSADAVLEEYVNRYGEEPSSPYWAHAYDATTLLLDAISASAAVDEDGTLVIDRLEVRRSLHSTSGYGGLIGTLSCDDFGDCGSQRLTIIEHPDPSDPDTSKQNIVFEYAPTP